MKVTAHTFVLSWLFSMIQGRFFLTLDEDQKYIREISTELWLSSDNFKRGDNNMEKSPQLHNLIGALNKRGNFFHNASITNSLTDLDFYLKNSLQRSIKSLLDWEKIVEWTNWKTEWNQNSRGQRGHFQEMKIKKELTFFVLLVILKTLGVLVTKIKMAIGIMLLKLLIGKLILLFIHLKSPKHHPGPLIKAYQTTTNEFHSHLGHKYDNFNEHETFFPSPPHIYSHSR